MQKESTPRISRGYLDDMRIAKEEEAEANKPKKKAAPKKAAAKKGKK